MEQDIKDLIRSIEDQLHVIDQNTRWIQKDLQTLKELIKEL